MKFKAWLLRQGFLTTHCLVCLLLHSIQSHVGSRQHIALCFAGKVNPFDYCRVNVSKDISGLLPALVRPSSLINRYQLS
jgi:hypothetical protein